jgi:aminopeptidase N
MTNIVIRPKFAVSAAERIGAVTYGNQFRNGYLGRDWTGVGVSLKFDFIIIHESGHEWFGNSVTANDVSDAWIQEGFTTWAEMVYVEHVFGYKDAIKYVNGYKEKVRNLQPIIGPTGLNQWPTSDMYFKGALFLHTLRSIADDDQKWWKTIKSYAKEFKHKNIWTSDVLNFFNEKLDADLKPIFDQYLRHADIPTFQYAIENGVLRYRFKADVANFAMPIKIGIGEDEKWIYPTTVWQEEMISASEISVRDDLVYVDIEEI